MTAGATANPPGAGTATRRGTCCWRSTIALVKLLRFRQRKCKFQAATATTVLTPAEVNLQYTFNFPLHLPHRACSVLRSAGVSRSTSRPHGKLAYHAMLPCCVDQETDIKPAEAASEPGEAAGVASHENTSGAASHGTGGPTAGPDADSGDGDDGEEVQSALRAVKRRRAATPASRSVSASSAGSDPAACGALRGMASGRLRKRARDTRASSKAVCARCMLKVCFSVGNNPASEPNILVLCRGRRWHRRHFSPL